MSEFRFQHLVNKNHFKPDSVMRLNWLISFNTDDGNWWYKMMQAWIRGLFALSH